MNCNLTVHLSIQNKLPTANYSKRMKMVGNSKDKRTVHLPSQHAVSVINASYFQVLQQE